MAKLTNKQLEAITPQRSGAKIRDDGGLIGIVRGRSDGGVSVKFDWRYRFEGRIRTTTCGTWPKNSLADIRAERNRLRLILENGKDPAEEKQMLRLKAKADQAESVRIQQLRLSELDALQDRKTVRTLFKRWSEVDLIRRKDRGQEVRRMFEKDVLPIVGDIALQDIRKSDITDVTDALLSRGVIRMAKLIFSLMRQMFRFAVDRELIESDPTASIRKARIGGSDTERDRVLSDDEIKQLSRNAAEAGLMRSTELAIWIALSTCCRIGELLNAQWSHVDFDNKKWFIPAENSKNGKAHTIYLSQFAGQQFAALKSITGTTPWCYPNRGNKSSVCVKTVTKQIGDRQRPGEKPMSRRAKADYADKLVLPGGKWTPHDLRRTGATIMVRLGVLPEVAERCLNHTEENKAKRTYQRYSYEKEMREAWDILGNQLHVLTSSENVPCHLSTDCADLEGQGAS